MFETNMDEYLDEEVESVKHAFELICKEWEYQMQLPPVSAATSNAADPHVSPNVSPHLSSAAPRFLASHNPAQVKRNLLASFTTVLLLPVTIVPRTVGAVGGALMTGGTAAVQGIAMLNPARWGGAGAGAGITRGGVSASGWGNTGGGAAGYSKELGDATLFEAGADEEGEEKGDDVGWGEGKASSAGECILCVFSGYSDP